MSNTGVRGVLRYFGVASGSRARLPGNPSLPVTNGNHRAAPEKVVRRPAVIGFSCQGSPDYQVVVIAGVPQVRQHAIVAGRAVTKLKGLD